MKVQISIRGRSYTLRTDEDEDLPAIARMVDAKMAEIASRSPRLDEYSIAMLTALNLASELEQLRREVDADLAAVDRELAATGMLLEAMTGEPNPAPAETLETT